MGPHVRVLAAMLCISMHAFGQDSAADLKKRGDDLLHASDFKGALDAYEQSYKLEPNPAILYNRCRALEGLGRYVEALDAIEQFDRDASPDLKARVPRLEALKKDLRAHVSSLAITSQVSGAKIYVRDVEVGTTPLSAPVRVSSGPATLDVRAAGYQPFHVSMDLPGGSLTNIDAPLAKEGEKAPPPKIVLQEDRPPTTRRVIAISLAGLGIAAAAVGVVMLGLRESDAGTLNKACPNAVCPLARKNELDAVRNRALFEGPMAAALFIGAGVSVAVAAIVWPWSYQSQTQIAVRGASLSLEGTF